MRSSPWMLALLASVPTLVAAAGTHPFSVHDMVAMDRLSEPQVSPNGQWVVFVVRATDLDANRGRTDLWRVGIDGKGLRRLTSHEANESNPRFTPDGKSILFLSTRSGSSQVWRMPLDAGEPEQVTKEPADVTSLAVSPDGTRIAYTLDVFAECGTIECTEERLADAGQRKTTARVFDKLFIRHWDAWNEGRRSHVFVRPLAGTAAIDVMKGMDADCPSKPFGGPEEYTFTPDSSGIVFTARDAGREEAWSTDLDLYLAPVDGSAPPKCLTERNTATDTQPLFSPDGKTLAYLAMQRAGYEADRYRIVLHPWPAGQERVLSESWDRSPHTFAWSEDAKTLYAAADNVGNHSLFAIDLATGRPRTLVEKGEVRAIIAGGGRVIYALDHLRAPTDLYTVKTDGTGTRQITRFNSERIAAVRMGEPEQMSFAGWNGEKVYAWIVKPVDFDPAQSYPVAFLIHGGPQGSFGNDFHYRWNPQAYAGAGYAAVMVDFHGSTGYGQAFTDSIRGDWGGKPLVDLQKGLEAALARYSWMDGKRVCALGASYGGYMVNWIAGRWSDPFRCLVNHDGNLDERMAYFGTEELWFPEWERGGTPWDHPEGYVEHNPIDHVGNWKTPMLVIHGALDYRVVDSQGIATFTALQRRGVPSKLVHFPDENHWVLKPHNSIFWHETVIGWLDQWTK